MPITFGCPCGKTLRVNDELAGKKARCPACQAVLPIPTPEPGGFELATPAAGAAPALARRATAVPVAPARRDEPPDDDEEPYRAKKSSRRDRDEDDEDDDRPRSRRRRDEEDDDEDDRPRKKRKKRVDVDHGPQTLEGRVFNGTVVGGLLAMFIAVVVFFGLGLFAGVWWLYAPILFVIGLVGFIKGLVSGGDE